MRQREKGGGGGGGETHRDGQTILNAAKTVVILRCNQWLFLTALNSLDECRILARQKKRRERNRGRWVEGGTDHTDSQTDPHIQADRDDMKELLTSLLKSMDLPRRTDGGETSADLCLAA